MKNSLHIYFLFCNAHKNILIVMKRINWILISILITGAALRFFGFPNIPFTYDELSAWGRTGYNSFSELIDQGVRGDGHPALIQVFLNYWRVIFGDSEAAFTAIAAGVGRDAVDDGDAQRKNRAGRRIADYFGNGIADVGRGGGEGDSGSGRIRTGHRDVARTHE